MSQQSVRQAARRSALDAQAVLRKERADRERRLEGLAVNVLTALGERDGAVRDAERRAGEALQTMTIDEGLSLREAVAWCGSGALTVREVTRLRQLAHDPPGGRPMSRATHPPSGHSLSHPSGLPHRRVAAALCVELNGLDGGSDDTFR
jgi:hypothetical protein